MHGMTIISLKPCPFCGDKPQWIKMFLNKSQQPCYELQCMNPLCPIAPCTDAFEKTSEAAYAWNTRKEA